MEGELYPDKVNAVGKSLISKIYPDNLLNAVGRSLIKANVADQMTNCLLVNATTHFRARCTRLRRVLGLDRTRAKICVGSAFGNLLIWWLENLCRESSQLILRKAVSHMT